ncbi:uncharacterized protein LOC129757784 [Uranotaenia lowii]|uniref:uncharacterized protein LOC129757784 n=1 Tax=Uranotaenia lowii TaxID=190385 RepID=UPI0024799CEE|nr:uncharacterized protein LOC129757784 [Uranotaenia lowii]
MAKNHLYLEAVLDGDLPNVQYYLDQKPEVDINYQTQRLRGALHCALDARRNAAHHMVALLIERGIDCDLRDDQMLTASELGLVKKQTGLVELMIQEEFKGVSKEDAFYRLIRRGCMELICIYIEQQGIALPEAIKWIEEAYEALRDKNVPLGFQIRFEIYQQLLQYHNTNPTVCDMEQLGMTHEQLVKYIDIALEYSDEDNLNEMNLETRMALRVLVQQLYLMELRLRHEKMIPLSQLVKKVHYCLCVLVKCFEETDAVAVEKLIINKSIILQYLGLIQRINNLSENDKKLESSLNSTYISLQETASLQKATEHLKEALSIDFNKPEENDLKQLAFQRCLQVIGESLKSTDESPNLSRELRQAWEQLVSSKTASCYSSIRQFFTGGYPLARYLLEKDDKSNKMYKAIQENLQPMLLFVEYLFSSQLILIERRFFSTLLEMNNLKQINSYAAFVGSEVVAVYKAHSFGNEFYDKDKIFEYCQQIKQLRADDSDSFRLVQELENELSSVTNMIRTENSNNRRISKDLGLILRIARENRNQANIRAVLNFVLTRPYQRSFLEFISSNGQTWRHRICETLSSVVGVNLTNPALSEIVRLASQLEWLVNYQFAYGVHKLQLKRFNALDSLSEQYAEQFLRDTGAWNPESSSGLSKKLKRQYESNIFNLNDRFELVNSTAQVKDSRVRAKLEEEFQTAFDRKITTLRTLIQRDMHLGLNDEQQFRMFSSRTVQCAVDQLLLQITEILIGVGYFERNVHMLGYRVPIISGKNLRDCLAHDSFKFAAICENDSFLLCNALFYINGGIQLYDKTNWPNLSNGYHPTFYLKKKMEHIKSQNDMYENIASMKVPMHQQPKLIGADILGLRSETSSKFKRIQTNALTHALTQNFDTFLAHVEAKEHSESIQYLIYSQNNPIVLRKRPVNYTLPEKVKMLLKVALSANDFEAYQGICKRYHVAQPFHVVYQENPYVLDYLEVLDIPITEAVILDVIMSGNLAVFKKVMEKSCVEIIDGQSLTSVALSVAQTDIATWLIDSNGTSIDFESISTAVIYHFNIIFEKLLKKFKGSLDWTGLLKLAIKADNFEAISLMEIHGLNPELYKDSSIIKLSAKYDRLKIFKHILKELQNEKCMSLLNEGNDSVINIFAALGNFEAVCCLIDVLGNYSEVTDYTFERAMEGNSPEIVELLLKQQSKPESNLLQTILNWCIVNNHCKLLKHVLKTYKVKLEDQFLLALRLGKMESIHILYEYDSTCAKTVDANGWNGYHVLAYTYNSSSSCLEHLLNILEQASVDASAQTSSLYTPLHVAVVAGDRNLVSKFIQLAPGTIDTPDIIGSSPLVTALLQGFVRIADLLYKTGSVDHTIIDTFRHPIFDQLPLTFILHHDHELLQYALETLGSNTEMSNFNGQTLLHIASQEGDLAKAHLLLQNRANIDARDRFGETPLHYAVRNGHRDLVEYFITLSNCNVDLRNLQQQTPLVLAYVVPNRLQFVELLTEAGAEKEVVLQFLSRQCALAMEELSQLKL